MLACERSSYMSFHQAENRSLSKIVTVFLEQPMYLWHHTVVQPLILIVLFPSTCVESSGVLRKARSLHLELWKPSIFESTLKWNRDFFLTYIFTPAELFKDCEKYKKYV